MSTLAKLRRLIQVGNELEIIFLERGKNLGKYKIQAIYGTTLACKSPVSENIIYFPNPNSGEHYVSCWNSDSDGTGEVTLYENEVAIYQYRIKTKLSIVSTLVSTPDSEE